MRIVIHAEARDAIGGHDVGVEEESAAGVIGYGYVVVGEGSAGRWREVEVACTDLNPWSCETFKAPLLECLEICEVCNSQPAM